LFHLAEKINANGRVYPKSLLEREVKNIMPLVETKSVYGALDHPTDPTMRLSGEYGACHVITNLKMKGNEVLGELEVLGTHNGKELRAIIESGGRIGISSRGLGSLKENDNNEKVVQEDYQLITWDVVPNPSTPEAWLSENQIFQNFSKINEDNNREIKKHCDSELTLRNRISDLFGG
jgi:hypothetical protein